MSAGPMTHQQRILAEHPLIFAVKDQPSENNGHPKIQLHPPPPSFMASRLRIRAMSSRIAVGVASCDELRILFWFVPSVSHIPNITSNVRRLNYIIVSRLMPRSRRRRPCEFFKSVVICGHGVPFSLPCGRQLPNHQMIFTPSGPRTEPHRY